MRDYITARLWAIVLVGLLSGAVGVALVELSLHLATDHQTLHALLTLELQREAAAKGGK